MQRLQLIFLLPLFFGFSLFAQEEEDDVQRKVDVHKPYEPSVSDARKINELPNIEDTEKVVPDFDYSITSKQAATEFELKPMKAAKMKGEPLDEMRYSRIKLGFGNYTTPLAEIDFNLLRSEKYAFGARLKHHSSHGKIKMANEKVFAGFGENQAQTFGKLFFDAHTLSADIGYRQHSVYFYGFNENDTIVPATEKSDMDKQVYKTFHSTLRFQTNYQHQEKIGYGATVDFSHFSDDYDNKEKTFCFDANANKLFLDKFIADIDAGIHFYDSLYTLLELKPVASLKGENWNVSAGLKADFLFSSNLDNETHISPEINAWVNIADYVVPYIGYTGKIQPNHYQRIAGINPFIKPGLYVKPGHYNMNIYGGFRGNIGLLFMYNLKAEYAKIKDMYFFINDIETVTGGDGTPVTLVKNKFVVNYDDISRLHLSGELAFRQSNEINIIFIADYYSYTMDLLEEAWHKPTYKLTLSGQYKFIEELHFHADIFLVGKRLAKAYNDVNDIELDSYVDINLGASYQLNKNFAAFVQFNNITGAKYYHWNYYRSHGFNAMGGLIINF